MIKIAPWVAHRTYNPKNKSPFKTLIFNNLEHEYMVLDGPSSEIWLAIENENTSNQLIELSSNLGVQDDLEDFIELLISANLIIDTSKNDLLPKNAIKKSSIKNLEDSKNFQTEKEQQQWVAKNGFLYAAHWEITFRCNESCVHCYNPGAVHSKSEKSDRQRDELTTIEAYKLLSELKEAGVFRLALSGGEVTLRKDFWEIFKEARRLGFAVTIFTNGLNFGPSEIDKLASLWPNEVSISVYSSSPEIHDSITRVPGSHLKSVTALKSIRDRGIRTAMKSVQMKHSVDGWESTLALAKEVDATPEVDLNMSSGADGASSPLALAADDPQKLILMAATSGSPIFVGGAENNYSFVKKDFEASVCGAGVGSMSIDPEGNIFPCASLPIPSGTFRKDGFINIWSNSKVGKKRSTQKNQNDQIENNVSGFESPAKVLSNWQKISLKDYHECGTHDRCGWCSKCPGMAMLEHGDPLAPSTVNCRIAAARMYAAKFLSKGYTREMLCDLFGVEQSFGKIKSEKFELPVLVPELNRKAFQPSLIALNVLTNYNQCESACSSSCADKSAAPNTVSVDATVKLEISNSLRVQMLNLMEKNYQKFSKSAVLDFEFQGNQDV